MLYTVISLLFAFHHLIDKRSVWGYNRLVDRDICVFTEHIIFQRLITPLWRYRRFFVSHSSTTHRDSWKSNWGFVLACIGSAVGMGNIWMFPTRVSKYGGGTFLLPYFLFVIIIGLSGVIGEWHSGGPPVPAPSEPLARP